MKKTFISLCYWNVAVGSLGVERECPLSQMDCLSGLFQDGHFEFCVSNETVKRLRIHDEAHWTVFLGDHEGVCGM